LTERRKGKIGCTKYPSRPVGTVVDHDAATYGVEAVALSTDGARKDKEQNKRYPA
jgi:hypothetical protein